MVEADRNMFEDVSDKKLKLDSFQSESKIVKKVFLNNFALHCFGFTFKLEVKNTVKSVLNRRVNAKHQHTGIGVKADFSIEFFPSHLLGLHNTRW